ncbi:MAG TPA: hypothetical protein VGI54_08115 [Solirubrobacteraceae bacterium]
MRGWRINPLGVILLLIGAVFVGLAFTVSDHDAAAMFGLLGVLALGILVADGLIGGGFWGYGGWRPIDPDEARRRFGPRRRQRKAYPASAEHEGELWERERERRRAAGR